MKLASIRNLSSTQVAVWDTDLTECPSKPVTFPSKELYREWCASKDTHHTFISTGFGLQRGVRASSTQNQLVKLSVVVAEYDAKGGPLNFTDFPYPPNWVCKTFSGHLRVWWELPKEIPLENPQHREAFLKIFFKEVKAIKIFPGFSLDESINVYQFYEVGWDWERVSVTPSIPENVIQGWSFRALESKWPAERTQIPFEKVRDECAKRWADVGIQWDAWSPGTRCHRFWDPGADAEAAIVTEHGMRCWTGDQAFVPWSSFLGANWVRQQTDTLIGSAINGWYWESAKGRYWRKSASSKWHSHTSTDVRLRLNAAGLSESMAKGETISPAGKAVIAIQDLNAVHGIFPAFYNPDPVVCIAGNDYLNTSTVRALIPYSGTCLNWGDGFLWLANYFEKLFKPEQLKYYLHWLAEAYRGALSGRPQRGLVLCIAGGVGVGKTFLNRQIHKRLFGGVEDASKYITGADGFNSFLVGCPFWSIDDAILGNDLRSREFYSQMIKMTVANEGVIIRGMHREGFLAPWCGRLCITMNDDPDSLKMLPHTDISNKDKLMVLHAQAVGIAAADWISDAHVEAELLYFAAYLRDMTVDPAIWGGRFGVQPYLDPDIIASSESIGASAGTKEIIELWAAEYFEDHRDVSDWTGNATQLDQAISVNESLGKLLHRQTKKTSDLQHDLRKLFNQHWPPLDEARNKTGSRIWKIVKSKLNLCADGHE